MKIYKDFMNIINWIRFNLKWWPKLITLLLKTLCLLITVIIFLPVSSNNRKLVEMYLNLEKEVYELQDKIKR